MNPADIAHARTIAAPIETVLRQVRDALAGVGLSVSGECDVPGGLNWAADAQSTRSRMLYVDSPLSLFEALALDRAAAVFLPLHVLVATNGPQTRVYWVKPAEVFDGRLPPGAAVPLGEIQTRLERALEPWDRGKL